MDGAWSDVNARIALASKQNSHNIAKRATNRQGCGWVHVRCRGDEKRSDLSAVFDSFLPQANHLALEQGTKRWLKYDDDPENDQGRRPSLMGWEACHVCPIELCNEIMMRSLFSFVIVSNKYN
eukprot:scaffold140989_cov30-Attheya_sp.AAC.1